MESSGVAVELLLALAALGGLGGAAGLVSAVSTALKLRRDAHRDDLGQCREALAEALDRIEALVRRDGTRQDKLYELQNEMDVEKAMRQDCQRRLDRLEEESGVGAPRKE